MTSRILIALSVNALAWLGGYIAGRFCRRARLLEQYRKGVRDSMILEDFKRNVREWERTRREEKVSAN